MAQAAECSRRTGMQWILKFGFANLDDVTNEAQEVRTRAIVSGLLPYVIATQYNEEWCGQAKTGKWGPPSFELLDAVVAYGNHQQQILKNIFGLPVIYVDAFVNNNRAYGLTWYCPEPNHDIFGIETYVPKGQTWESFVEVPVQYVLNTTTKPLILVGQTFKHPKKWNDQWQDGPKPSDGQKFKILMQHPRVLAAWLFTWRNRPNGIIGAESMPTVVGWFR
jgi:hypothetical protein